MVKSFPSKVIFDSAFKVFAVPDPVITLLSALLLIVVWVMPVKLEPSPLNDVAVSIPDKTPPIWVVSNFFDPLKYNSIQKVKLLRQKGSQLSNVNDYSDFKKSPLENLLNDFVSDIKNERFQMHDLNLAKNTVFIICLLYTSDAADES